MRLAFIILTFLCSNSFATNYYVKSSGGTGSGLDDLNAWSFAKFKTMSFSAGDSILFKRGDTFYGSFIVGNSGTSGNPIVYGAYGVGAKPIITGFTDITSWTNLGGNIWESGVVSTLGRGRLVLIDGVNTARGRWPNTGWRPIGVTDGGHITDETLPDGINFVLGEIVSRQLRGMDRDDITDQAGKTLTAEGGNPQYPFVEGYGYFIQNNVNTLDTINEWYYMKGTKKLRIYNTVEPQNVRITTLDSIVSIYDKNYITFDNIHFSGANRDIFRITGNNITIQNCDLNYAATHAIYHYQTGMSDFRVTNNSFKYNNNYGVFVDGATNTYIGYNHFDSTALVLGSGEGGDLQMNAIFVASDSLLVEYNTILNTGYTPIFFLGNNSLVQKNFLYKFCSIKDDGGGIYTWSDKGVLRPTPNRQRIFHNIILNGIGNGGGTNQPNASYAHGVYMDNLTSNTEVAYNTMANCAGSGIFSNYGSGNYVHDNLSYNNQSQVEVLDEIASVTNYNLKHNLFIAKDPSQYTASYTSVIGNRIASFGTFDSNYYAKPIRKSSWGNKHIQTSTDNYTNSTIRVLSNFQSIYSQDLHSFESAVTIPQGSDLDAFFRLEYNASDNPKTVNLGAKYIEVDSTIHNGTVTIPAWSSKVLIYDSPIVGGEKFLKTPSGKFLKTPGGKFIITN